MTALAIAAGAVLLAAQAQPQAAKPHHAPAQPQPAVPEKAPHTKTSPARRFAVVVGWNAPPRPDLPTLRYADDDAVRWAVLLRSLGADVQLLAVPDAESRRLYGAGLPSAQAPARAALVSAVRQVAARIADAKAEGARTVLYFVYAGHGDVENGEGYVALADGRFFRRDLEAEVLARSGADVNHVIVDACRSFYFVYGRGPGGQRKPWQASYFSSEAAARFPNTGFLLSSSSDAPSHEWEEFQAGIFSHEVRSGLLGAADVNGDHRIDYREIEGFVRVANDTIRNERFRPSIVARPPRGGDAELIDLGAAAGGGQVRIEADAPRRQSLEDALGVRWADLHSGAGLAVTLRLPAGGWTGGDFYLRTPDGDREYRVPAGRASVSSALEAQRSPVLRRGAVHDAFRRLFERPFDAAALSLLPAEAVALAAETDPRDEPPPASLWRTTAQVLVAAGVVGLGVAGGLWWSARALREEGLAADGERRQTLNEGIDDRNRWSLVSGVAGAALLGVGGGLWLWDQGRRDSAATAVAFAPVRGGGLLQLTFTGP